MIYDLSHLGSILGRLGLAQNKPASSQGCEQMGSMLLPILLMFVIIYFLIIRPQQKQQKKHQEMLNSLTKGDRVITNSGILGTITGISDGVITLEVAKNVHIRVLRSAIAGKQPPEGEKMPDRSEGENNNK